MGTKDRLLESGAFLFANKGYHGVGIEELGAHIGLTGPSIYRHFSTKSALLAEMLITVSKSLLEGADRVLAKQLDPKDSLLDLIGHHTKFALRNPDLIRVQERDFSNLTEADAKQVRGLQRRYVEIWVQKIMEVRVGISVDTARTMAHAVFGMLNSTPRIRSTQNQSELAEIMNDLAQRALLN